MNKDKENKIAMERHPTPITHGFPCDEFTTTPRGKGWNMLPAGREFTIGFPPVADLGMGTHIFFPDFPISLSPGIGHQGSPDSCAEIPWATCVHPRAKTNRHSARLSPMFSVDDCQCPPVGRIYSKVPDQIN